MSVVGGDEPQAVLSQNAAEGDDWDGSEDEGGDQVATLKRVGSRRGVEALQSSDEDSGNDKENRSSQDANNTQENDAAPAGRVPSAPQSKAQRGARGGGSAQRGRQQIGRAHV